MCERLRKLKPQLPFFHGNTQSVVTGEFSLKTASKLEERCVRFSTVAVLVIASERPLVFANRIAFIRGRGSRSVIPDIVAEGPLS